MAEVSNTLLHSSLQDIQARLGNIEQSQKETVARLSAIQTHLMAVEKDVLNIHEALSALDNRLERVERRLDMVNEPGK